MLLENSVQNKNGAAEFRDFTPEGREKKKKKK